MRPAGAVAMFEPSDLLGRGIAMASRYWFSHTGVAHGNGDVVDSTSPRVRIESEEFWTNTKRRAEWYAPVVPFTEEETRVLKSNSYIIEDRVEYYYKNFFDFLIKGAPTKRGHGLFCTHLVAELYILVRDLDFSGTEEPWKIDITKLVEILRNSGHFYLMEE